MQIATGTPLCDDISPGGSSGIPVASLGDSIDQCGFSVVCPVAFQCASVLPVFPIMHINAGLPLEDH